MPFYAKGLKKVFCLSFYTNPPVNDNFRSDRRHTCGHATVAQLKVHKFFRKPGGIYFTPFSFSLPCFFPLFHHLPPVIIAKKGRSFYFRTWPPPLLFLHLRLVADRHFPNHYSKKPPSSPPWLSLCGQNNEGAIKVYGFFPISCLL